MKGVNYVSAPLVVNDGTGIVKDLFLPGYHTFDFPDPNTSATYRVQTTVWWTSASTSPTFGSVTWSVSEKPGPHYLNVGLMYIWTGLECKYQAPTEIVIKS